MWSARLNAKCRCWNEISDTSAVVEINYVRFYISGIWKQKSTFSKSTCCNYLGLKGTAQAIVYWVFKSYPILFVQLEANRLVLSSLKKYDKAFTANIYTSVGLWYDHIAGTRLFRLDKRLNFVLA